MISNHLSTKIQHIINQRTDFMNYAKSLVEKYEVQQNLVISTSTAYLEKLLTKHGDNFDLSDDIQNSMFWDNTETLIKLEKAGICDLTGLQNRKTYNRELQKRVGFCRDNKNPAKIRPLSLILIDLDHFKSVNDTYGHTIGDTVLKEVGSVIISHSRCTDFCARWGGEELAIIVEGDTGIAYMIAERIRNDINLLSFENSEKTDTFSITASFGISTYEHKENALDLMTKRADKSLYKAKNNGRDQIVIYGTY